MPQAVALHTAPSVQHAVIAQRALGNSKSKIARELGLDRETVARILAIGESGATNAANVPQNATLIQQSYDAVAEGLTSTDARIKATDRASIGLRVLESTVWSHNAQPATHINIEKFASISQLMPSDAAGPKQPQSPPQASERIAAPTIFSLSDISTADLRAELARREHAAATPLLASPVEEP